MQNKSSGSFEVYSAFVISFVFGFRCSYSENRWMSTDVEISSIFQFFCREMASFLNACISHIQCVYGIRIIRPIPQYQ
ncbi:hypothetical protein X975_23842, partial [Stegodyphus mimosarum]